MGNDASPSNISDEEDDVKVEEDDLKDDDGSCADFCRVTINGDNGDNLSCLSSDDLHDDDTSMSAIDDDDDGLGDEDDNGNCAPPRKDRNELTISLTSTSS